MIRTVKKSSDGKRKKEFDVIGASSDKVFWNETKSTPSLEYITTFAESVAKLELLEYFPEYKNKKIIPLFSSLAFAEALVT
jgi:hypothetical protein